MSRNAAQPVVQSALMTRPKVPAVNLIPTDVARGHVRRRLQVLALLVAGAVVVAIGLVYGVLAVLRGEAKDRLADAKAESERIASERLEYRDVIAINERVALVEDALVTTMGYEVLWADLLQGILESKPDPSGLVSISVRSMSAGAAIAPTNSNPLARQGVGSISLTLQFTSTEDVVKWIQTLEAMPGVEYANYDTVASMGGAEGEFQYTVQCTAQVDLSRLSGKVLGEDFRAWRDKTMTPGDGE
jgi:hypothetical protein